jgi:hypothetical protein
MTLLKKKTFIMVLINTTSEQAWALLYIITDQQSLAISEILYNLPYQNVKKQRLEIK